MEKKELELKMYFLVMYNLSGIQKGIQTGHSVVEYQNEFGKSAEYKRWAKNYKTFIILNGGTSNDGAYSSYGHPPEIGTMQEHKRLLEGNFIPHACFREPDANNAMTAIAFLVDERVFNFKDYPDFKTFCFVEEGITDASEDMPERYKENYEKWLKLIGGKQNAFLKDFLHPSKFKLA